MTNARQYDVVVFGATGFTGRLVVEYLTGGAAHGARIAIAGRSRDKLADIAEHAKAKHGMELGIIQASADDRRSLGDMARAARVVLTTVGPYAEHGLPVVEACVAEGADYVDITGEPEFVADVLDRFGASAKAAGVRLVSCCGFDSVPHDLGVYFAVRELAQSGPCKVEGFVQAGGTISGGTWHSAIGAFSRMKDSRHANVRLLKRDPGPRRARSTRPTPRYEPEVSGWVVPMPTIDPVIVLRSAMALDAYGPDFSYGHYMRVGSLFRAASLGAGVGAVVALAQLAPTRELLLKIKKQGDGPSEAQRERSYFRVTFVARAGGEKLIARVSGGDPGYTETSKMVSESALALVQDRERLPERVGVLTPAAAFGDVLVERLQRAGIRFEVVRRTRD